MDAQQLTDIKFSERKKGYDPDEVDNFLEKLGEAVVKLQEKVREAGRRADDAENRASVAEVDKKAAAAAGMSEGELGEMLKKTLLLAQRTADDTVKEAKAEAGQLVDEARKKAARLVEDANRDSAKALAAAESEVKEKASSETKSLRTQVKKLESVREQLVTDIENLEIHLDGVRARVRSGIDELSELIDNPKRFRAGDRPELKSLPSKSPASASPTPAASAGQSTPRDAASAPASQSGARPATSASRGAAKSKAPGGGPPKDMPARTTTPGEAAKAAAAATPATVPPADKAVAAAAMAGAADSPKTSSTSGPPPAHPATDGPPTQPLTAVDRADDGFLDELKRAVTDEPLGVPDEAADAAMTAFFEQDDDEASERRARFGRKR